MCNNALAITLITTLSSKETTTTVLARPIVASPMWVSDPILKPYPRRPWKSVACASMATRSLASNKRSRTTKTYGTFSTRHNLGPRGIITVRQCYTCISCEEGRWKNSIVILPLSYGSYHGVYEDVTKCLGPDQLRDTLGKREPQVQISLVME